MMKIFGFAAVTASALALSACGQAEAEPQPDPRHVALLVAKLDAADAAAATPAKVQEKLGKAEGVVTTLDRSEPDRLAGAAELLLAK